MVRYAREHKQQTRQRIIATAGRRLKRDGIDGSGVATLMKDAGLLNANIVAQAEPGPAGLEQIGRCADAIRQAYADGVLVVVDGLAARMAPEDPPSARVRALSLLGLMAGTFGGGHGR
ncbi:MAG: hypothetical protein ACJ73S_27290 [Mycobacteriales bacterium]